MEIVQYQIFLVNLDPTIGSEMKKTRPCLIISPDEMNENLQTLIIAPITSSSKLYPTRIEVSTAKTKGWIVIDQIRTIDRARVVKHLGKISDDEVGNVKKVIKEVFVD